MASLWQEPRWNAGSGERALQGARARRGSLQSDRDGGLVGVPLSFLLIPSFVTQSIHMRMSVTTAGMFLTKIGAESESILVASHCCA